MELYLMCFTVRTNLRLIVESNVSLLYLLFVLIIYYNIVNVEYSVFGCCVFFLVFMCHELNKLFYICDICLTRLKR